MIQPSETKRTAPPQAMIHDVSEFALDVVTLSELQWALFQEEWDENLRRVLRVVVMLAAAAILMLCCVPVALMTVAYTIHALGIGLAWSFAIATFLGVLTAFLVAATAWSLYRSAQPMFAKSKEELQQNVRWLKTVLSKNRRQAPDRDA